MTSILAVNLPLNYTPEKCHQYFNKYGDCTVNLINDYDPQYTGVSCIVKFKNFSSIEAVLSKSIEVENTKIRCTLKFKSSDKVDENLEYPYLLNYPEYYYNIWYSRSPIKRIDSGLQLGNL
eukprot:NODE_973_length_2663_cov_0.317473.p2 type:complete len:121 gc:universal NODE_973_length_2663_cov_0.317473:1161-1523(+)